MAKNCNGKKFHGKIDMSKTRQKQINDKPDCACVVCMLNYFYFYFYDFKY